MSSHIQITPGGSTVFAGEEAVRLFQAKTLKVALGLAMKGLRANPRLTNTTMLKVAGDITGITYKRGQLERARHDLTLWITDREKQIPVVQG